MSVRNDLLARYELAQKKKAQTQRMIDNRDRPKAFKYLVKKCREEADRGEDHYSCFRTFMVNDVSLTDLCLKNIFRRSSVAAIELIESRDHKLLSMLHTAGVTPIYHKRPFRRCDLTFIVPPRTGHVSAV